MHWNLITTNWRRQCQSTIVLGTIHSWDPEELGFTSTFSITKNSVSHDSNQTIHMKTPRCNVGLLLVIPILIACKSPLVNGFTTWQTITYKEKILITPKIQMKTEYTGEIQYIPLQLPQNSHTIPAMFP